MILLVSKDLRYFSDLSVVTARIGYAALQLCGGGCVLKKEVATPSSVVLVELIFVCISLRAGGRPS